jgi:hypothetical protein
MSSPVGSTSPTPTPSERFAVEVAGRLAIAPGMRADINLGSPIQCALPA